jgi:hypothetical protein
MMRFLIILFLFISSNIFSQKWKSNGQIKSILNKNGSTLSYKFENTNKSVSTIIGKCGAPTPYSYFGLGNGYQVVEKNDAKKYTCTCVEDGRPNGDYMEVIIYQNSSHVEWALYNEFGTEIHSDTFYPY